MTCVRLMHHLVESIFRRRNDPAQAADARANLVRILDATVSQVRHGPAAGLAACSRTPSSAERGGARGARRSRKPSQDALALGITTKPPPGTGTATSTAAEAAVKSEPAEKPKEKEKEKEKEKPKKKPSRGGRAAAR